MQETKTYRLNLIEGSDDFSPAPLNQNMERVEAALDALPKFHIISWTGDGGSTRRISFPFQPRMVILSQAYFSGAGTLAVIYGQEKGYRMNSNGGGDVLNMTWSGKELSMSKNYYNASDDVHFNAANAKYFAMAFQ